MIKHTRQDLNQKKKKKKKKKNPNGVEFFLNAIICDSYKSNMMQDMHKLTNHCNQEQEKMKNLKVMEVLKNVVMHNNCKSNIMHAQINPPLQLKTTMNNNVRKAHKQNERFMKDENLIMECPSSMCFILCIIVSISFYAPPHTMLEVC
jgi:hypothetical protein